MTHKSKQYIENGLVVLEKAIDKKIIANLRQEIVDVINEVSIDEVNYDGSEKSFQKETTNTLWTIVNTEPKKRSLIYNYIQRTPSLYQLANLEVLRNFANDIGMKKPSIREIKVQMYLPWEKLFFQDCHQDINSLDSENSVTFWFPLHYINEKSAVSYHKYSHKEGPVKHKEYIEEENGLYMEYIPKEYQEKYPEVEKAIVNEGDLIALNRLVFHTSPKFEEQDFARWIVLVRYDDIANNGLYTNTTKYEEYTVFNLKRYQNEILPKIKDFLTKKPKFKWEYK